MSKAAANKFAKALEDTGLFQAVNVTNTSTRVSVIGRVVNGAEPKWLTLVTKLLHMSEGQSDWDAHFCKNFFLKNGNLVFGWNMAIQSKAISITAVINQLLPHMTLGAPAQPKKIIHQQKPRNADTMEVPLTDLVVGDGAELLPGRNVLDRNAPQPGSKKGAYSYAGGKAP